MSFFSEDFKAKSENDRREGIIAAINHQIDYLRRKIAYETGLACETARLRESIRDCESKIVGLTGLVIELRNFAGDWNDFISLVRKNSISYMSFNDSHEKDTALVLFLLANQSYSDVNQIFDNHKKGFGQEAPAEPLKLQFFSPYVQHQPAAFTQKQTPAAELAQKQKPADMQKVIDTKREIKLANQSYSDVNQIFDNHEKSFGQEAPAEPLKFQFFSPSMQHQPAAFTQKQTPAAELAQKQKPADMQKVIDTKREIKSYIDELKAEVLRKRFNPFVGYIAKNKLTLFEKLDEKIDSAHQWEDIREEVLDLYHNHKKALSAGTHQKSRAMGLITNILKNQPDRGQHCTDYALTATDLSYTSF